MTIRLISSDESPAAAVEANDLLMQDPIRNNVMLSLLQARASGAISGRWWLAQSDGAARSVVLQSPPNHLANVSLTDPAHIRGIVRAFLDADVSLPGIQGDAATALPFAAHWVELARKRAIPEKVFALYEVRQLPDAIDVDGHIRAASDGDKRTLVTFMRGFVAETGEGYDAEAEVDRRLRAKTLWVWEDGEVVCMASRSHPAGGASRVQTVYTHPDHRGRGYAGASVYHVARRTLDDGLRSILYTESSNATSAAAYAKVGYRYVGGTLRFRFDPA